MRIWTLHPRYLDPRGFTALWRDVLGARAVLAGETSGYRHHRQVQRFRAKPVPLDAIGSYLAAVHAESVRRRYRFHAANVSTHTSCFCGREARDLSQGSCWDSRSARRAAPGPRGMGRERSERPIPKSRRGAGCVPSEREGCWDPRHCAPHGLPPDRPRPTRCEQLPAKVPAGRLAYHMEETDGQLLYEWRRLLGKLEVRAPALYEAHRAAALPEPQPLFRIVPGPVRAWERVPAPRAGAGPPAEGR